MGLDMYLEALPKGKRIDRKKDRELLVEVAYWRKFNELQGYFERHYKQENCGYTKLSKTRIKKLLKILRDEDLRAKELITTTGFFYGHYAYEEEDINYTIEAFEEALEISDDYNIYYTCWY